MKIRYLIFVFLLEIIAICVGVSLNCRRLNVEKNKQTYEIHRIIEDDTMKYGKKGLIASNIEQLKLYAKSACVLDVKSNRVLYSKEADIALPMASTTKIMTCIVAIESNMLEKKAIVSQYAASMPKVKLGVTKGEEFLIKDLLYSLMLESHNDVAVVIAENIAAYSNNISIDVNNIEQSKKLVRLFARIMNEKAKKLGLKNTSFVTPNGLDDKNHYTTARELAYIGAYAIKNKLFIDITNTRNYKFRNNKGRTYSVNNKNSFLNSYTGAIGCKTGYTSKAGYCFVGAINRQDYHLVSVVLGSGWPPHKTYKWSDTVKLMDYVIDNYKVKVISLNNKTLNLKKVDVDYGSKSRQYKIDVSIDCQNQILLNENDKVSYKVLIPKKIIVPIDRGEDIGVCKLYVNEQLVNTFIIKATEKVGTIKYIDSLSTLKNYYLFSGVYR